MTRPPGTWRGSGLPPCHSMPCHCYAQLLDGNGMPNPLCRRQMNWEAGGAPPPPPNSFTGDSLGIDPFAYSTPTALATSSTQVSMLPSMPPPRLVPLLPSPNAHTQREAEFSEISCAHVVWTTCRTRMILFFSFFVQAYKLSAYARK